VLNFCSTFLLILNRKKSWNDIELKVWRSNFFRFQILDFCADQWLERGILTLKDNPYWSRLKRISKKSFRILYLEKKRIFKRDRENTNLLFEVFNRRDISTKIQELFYFLYFSTIFFIRKRNLLSRSKLWLYPR